MMQGALDISFFQLGICMVFVLLAGILSAVEKLKIEKELLIGSIRCVVQLVLMGYVLNILFQIDSPWPVAVLFIVMVSFGAHIIYQRVEEKRIPFILPTLATMAGGYFFVSVIVTKFVVQVSPWWAPQYFIPLAGMIVGNSMTALSLSLDRLFSDLRMKNNELEMKLCLGATTKEAGQDILRNSLKAGMVPSINSLAGVGLVFIPGMMTGQILAGVDPMLAVRYQIVVMFMLVASSAITVTVVLKIVYKRCFGKGQQPLLKPGR